MSLALFHQQFWEGAEVGAPVAPPAAPFPQGGILPLGRVRRHPAPRPVVPYHVHVDSASYEGLVRALEYVATVALPPRPLAPVVRPDRIAEPTRRKYVLTVRRVVVATAPPMAPPRRRPFPLTPEPEVEPAPTAPPAYTPPPPPPTVLPEERAQPPAPYPGATPEQSAIDALLRETVLPPLQAALPWDEEDADTVALMVSLLLED